MKDSSVEAQQEDLVIQSVVKVRNDTAHSTGGITKSAFEEMWRVLEDSLQALGYDTSSLIELRANPLKVCILLSFLVLLIFLTSTIC